MSVREAFRLERTVLYQGDAADLGEVLEPASIDAIVTDPPAGIGFMGKPWDHDRGGRDAWIAWLASTLAPAFRALKPGGFALVWALPRTSHWTALALELAGFEIRDRVSHFFGTGFPKSLNLSKAIDKHLGVEREVVGQGAANCRYLAAGEECRHGEREAGDFSQGATKHAPATAPGSPLAARWEGWGTALKPACEDWWLCQKPFAGTYAANLLAHGVGGINVEACRIEAGSRPLLEHTGRSGNVYGAGLEGSRAIGATAVGRWPAHVVLDDEAAAMLDASVPATRSRKGLPRAGRNGDGWGMTATGDEYDDEGGPSRFFFVAKAPRSEKDAGLEHLPRRSGGEATDREEGSAGLSNPRAGAGRTGGARNFHPTVKNTALMRWLVRLVTPPGGTVLDPFAGTGSTGVAARQEGVGFIGCELGEEYLPIAIGRLRGALAQTTLDFGPSPRERSGEAASAQLDLPVTIP